MPVTYTTVPKPYTMAYRDYNRRLLAQAEVLLRRLRQSEKLWASDTTKIDRVLLRAKARMIRRMYLTGAREWPIDRMLNTYA